MNPVLRLVAVVLLLGCGACASKEYAAPDWEIAGPWEPANPDMASTDNNLVLRPGLRAARLAQ